MPVAAAIDFRPDAPEFLRDPFPLYRRMREEDQVHWSPRLKSWVLTRYDDVKAVLVDKEVSSDRLHLEWLNSMVFRGMTSLPLNVSR
jgi:cytochrome P450